MADNYLEKKYEQFKNGPTVIRKVNPSLDTLLHRISDAAPAATAGAAPADVSLRSTPPQAVPPLTLPRVARSAGAEPDNLPQASADAIKQAQLDAIVRSASILGYTFRFETSEEKGSVYILGPNAPHSKTVELGETVLAMRLKAAELGFRTEVEIVRELLRAPQPHLATLSFFRG